MRQKLLRSMLLVALLSVGLLVAFVLPRLHGAFAGYAARELDDICTTLSLSLGEVPDDIAYLRKLEDHLPAVRLTWIGGDGTVRYDSDVAQEDAMDNHGQREEIAHAFATGAGNAVRRSASLGENTYYHAIRLADGTVLRASKTARTVFSEMLGILPSIVLIALLVVGICAAVAELLIHRLMEPINALDLEHPEENEAYAELAPLLARLQAQNRRIAQQLAENRGNAQKTAAITENMAEGLMLLRADGKVISMNRSAKALLGIKEEASIGHHYLLACRNLDLRHTVEAALAGAASENKVMLHGRTYQALASPVYSEGEHNGVVVLLLDITEREQADITRREFSANVSHELKTPLTTIAGYAEMMAAGLAPAQDNARLAGHILDEARRLLALIEDIIQLSRLDENAGDTPCAPVDLYALAQRVMARLLPFAQDRAVSMSLDGSPCLVNGSAVQLEEMMQNLVDNAIRYNTEGGNVSICVEACDDTCTVAVCDTGIGIPLEDQGRVFERFYRVDKSHSRQTGGTGLGLSIVKHCVQNHGGGIQLASAPGKGTTVSVMLPVSRG